MTNDRKLAILNLSNRERAALAELARLALAAEQRRGAEIVGGAR